MNPRVHRSRVTHDRWLVSYADFITLLFAFFVVLYAFAKADQKKQVEVSTAIDRAFRQLGVFPGAARSARMEAAAANQGGTLQAVVAEDAMTPAHVKDDLEQIRRELEKSLAGQLARHTVSIQMGPDGLVISLREAGFFNSGSAVPLPETLPTLRDIAASIAHSPYDVRVEGHTDNVPIHNEEFDSNWELSAVRATHIARMMLELRAIAPERLSAAGYAEFHPVDTNDTPDGRSKNRRVDLIILPKTKINFAAGPPSPPDRPWGKITDQ